MLNTSVLSVSSSNAKRNAPSMIFNVSTGASKPIDTLTKSYVPYSAVVRTYVYSGTRKNERIFEPNWLKVSSPMFFAIGRNFGFNNGCRSHNGDFWKARFCPCRCATKSGRCNDISSAVFFADEYGNGNFDYCEWYALNSSLHGLLVYFHSKREYSLTAEIYREVRENLGGNFLFVPLFRLYPPPRWI